MPRKSPHTVEDLAKLVEKYLRTKESAKRGYARADRLLLEIAKQVDPGAPIQLTAHRVARVIDKFASREIQWGHGAVRPYEIEVSES